MTSRDYRRIARENLRGNYWLSVAVAFVTAIFGALVVQSGSGIEISENVIHEMPKGIRTFLLLAGSAAGILRLVQSILGGTVQLGYCDYLLNQYYHDHLDIMDLFAQFSRFTEGFLQGFLRSLYVFLWSLLFIVPGIIKNYAYAMTPFILAEHPLMTAKEAIKESKELMNGHKIDLFLLDLSFFGWMILSVLTLGIGRFFLNPYMNAARAAFYKDITTPKTSNPNFYSY